MGDGKAASSTTVRRTRGKRALVKALPEDTRRHNKALVLQTLFPNAELARADIARMTGLTRVTVSDLVAELLSDGLLQELGIRESGRPGKPGTLLALASNSRSIISLNLADPDTIFGAVLDLNGNVIVRDSQDITGQSGDATLESTTMLARRLCAAAPRPVLGVGVGTPGMVDDDGVVIHAPNRSWVNVPLRAHLQQELGFPVLVSNDADASVLAEHSFGGRSNSVIVVYFALGVGAGLVLDGRLVHGNRSAAGEIGHVSIADDGELCSCGKRGCLETFISVPRLSAALNTHAADPAAVFADAGKKLATVLAPLVAALDFDEIVLSGPTELLDGALTESVRENLRARTRSAFRSDVQVRMTALGEDIVLLGSAAMVLSGQLGVS